MTSFAAALRRLDCLCLVDRICTELSPFMTPIVEKIQLILLVHVCQRWAIAKAYSCVM